MPTADRKLEGLIIRLWTPVTQLVAEYFVMFTRQKAVQFLQNSWKIMNVEKRLRTDRKKFLNEIIIQIHEKVPFQFITGYKLWLVPPEQRSIPSFEEINRACMTGEGGNCTYVNVFTRNLLQGLGYSAYHCRPTVTSTSRNPHLSVIVKDLEKKGDLHLIDCGLGFPSFRAISLNFDQESPVYQDSFLEYKYIHHDGKILRMHGNGDLIRQNDPPIEGLDFYIGKWRRFYELKIETIDCNVLDDLGSPAYTFKSLPSFLPPRAVTFLREQAVLIFAEKLFIENDDKSLQMTTMKSNEQILETYQYYFPTLNKDLILQAYSSWQQRTKVSKH